MNIKQNKIEKGSVIVSPETFPRCFVRFCCFLLLLYFMELPLCFVWFYSIFLFAGTFLSCSVFDLSGLLYTQYIDAAC